MTITAFSLNEIGGRKNVEDAIMPKKYQPKDPALFVVCDGVGGSSFGEVASDIATKAFYETLKNAAVQSEADFKTAVQSALKLFQKKVQEFVAENPSAASTSTTLTLLSIHHGKAYLAWCGDSKIYQIRDGNPVYKTRDHSLVADLVQQGVITEQEAVSHPQRNIITRSLSSNTKPTDIDTAVIADIREDDWFLLCTDGLMEQFTESLFPVVLDTFRRDTDYSEAIEKICSGKTKDNYSMYLLHMGGIKKAGGSKKILLPLILVALAAGGWYAYSQLAGKKEPAPPAQTPAAGPAGDTVKSIMMVRPNTDTTHHTNDTTNKK